MPDSSIYQLSALTTGIVNCLLLVFVLYKGLGAPARQIFFRYCSVIVVWSFTVFLATSLPLKSQAYFYSRFCHLGATFIPLGFLIFADMFFDLKIPRLIGKLIFSCSIFFTIILLFQPSLFFFDVEPKFGFPYFPSAGIFYSWWCIYFFVTVAYVHIKLLLKLLEPKTKNKNNIGFFLVANSLGYIGGIGCFLPVYNYTFFPFPYGPLGTTLFSLVTAYTIFRFKFLDIEVIIKRTIVFAGLFGMVMLVVTAVTEFTQILASRYMAVTPLFARTLSVLLALFLYDPTRKLLINVTDRYLFQKKYNYHKLLKENSKQIAFIHSLDELAKQVVGFLLTQGRIKNAGLFTRRESGIFDLRYPLGYRGKANRPRMQITEQHAAVHLLNEKHAPLVLVELEKDLRQSQDHLRQMKLTQVIQTMKELKAQVLIPSFLRSPEDNKVYSLTTVLVLGQKKSDEDYTEEDLDVFYTIAQDAAIAAENARLIDAIISERSRLVEAQQKAEMVNYTRTLKHESGNTLVSIETGALNMRSQLMSKLERLKGKLLERLSEPERKMYEELGTLTEKYARDFQQAGGKLRMTIDTVVGALSSDHEAKQMIYFKVPWDTAKRNSKIDHEFRYDVQVEDKFQIFGNVDLMERVFENFFNNSRDAVGNQPEKLIYLRASERDHESRKVSWFEYWDSGPGVPADLYAKVFLQNFSTKPKPKSSISFESGHGQGLYVCKKTIEEFHGGKIWLETHPETGKSRFVFWIPVKENL